VKKQTPGSWRVEVDRDRCMGTGACVYAIPQVFGMGDNGVAKVVGAVDEDDELVRNVVAECPTAALRLVRTSAALPGPAGRRRRLRCVQGLIGAARPSTPLSPAVGGWAYQQGGGRSWRWARVAAHSGVTGHRGHADVAAEPPELVWNN
jgi:ferredoxin